MTFSAEAVLDQLKDFQRATAIHTFDRLYKDPDTTHRYLVADEVGLGKTMVARGVIAQAIEHLDDKVDRIDIVYVCSNAQIARQNVRRLHVGDKEHFEVADRITMLPATAHELGKNKVNLISFTPGTSFELTGGSGKAEERALLRLMLKRAWGDDRFRSKGSMRAFQGGVRELSSFERRYQYTEDEYGDTLDESLLASFVRELRRHRDLADRFDEICDRFARQRKEWDRESRALRSSFVGDLRDVLARSCLEALEPDLIILDEFQRFKHLISDPPEGEERSPAAELAHELFSYVDDEAASQARVLLLSATPYKMLTRQSDDEDDHHEDLIDTVRFLLGEDAQDADELRHALRGLRHGLQQARFDRGDAAKHAAKAAERILRRVMVRTERLAATPDRSGMLRTQPITTMALDAGEVREYAAISRVARHLDAPDPVEYWKSSPYLLNFMDDYKLSQSFVDAAASSDPDLAKAMRPLPRLDLEAVRRFQRNPANNARLEWLEDDVIESGTWRLLWVPPSFPYLTPGGPFADPKLQDFTKRLLFSSWTVVPKAVATMLTFEAERRMVSAASGTAPYTNDKSRSSRGRNLAFNYTNERLTGMYNLGALFPHAELAKIGDPLALARLTGGRVDAQQAIATLASRISAMLVDLGAEPATSGTGDDTWYWAGGFLLDRAAGHELDIDGFHAASAPGKEREGDRLVDHLQRAASISVEDLGPMPPDTAQVLAEIAIGGPGCVAARALSRGLDRAVDDVDVRYAATTTAWGVRSLFNSPEVTELLRAEKGEELPYWRRVVQYCIDGNFQSVLDEYVHILLPARGHLDPSSDEALTDLAGVLLDTISLRTVNYGVRSIDLNGSAVTAGTARMRANFAVRLSDERSDDGSVTRSSEVRDAFNSPFWPFVLTTTSAGQEGLDFHPFCHAIVHWNLPGNPVDLEQREGRIHRFKGHAVRKNVARLHAPIALSGAGDPWTLMFDAAHQTRPADQSDVVPYWVYPLEGGATIDRYVPALPLSRDRATAAALQRAVGSYRLAFGQPRQEELLAILEEELEGDDLALLLDAVRIDLSPNDIADDDRGSDQRVSSQQFLPRTVGSTGRP